MDKSNAAVADREKIRKLMGSHLMRKLELK